MTLGDLMSEGRVILDPECFQELGRAYWRAKRQKQTVYVGVGLRGWRTKGTPFDTPYFSVQPTGEVYICADPNPSKFPIFSSRLIEYICDRWRERSE